MHECIMINMVNEKNKKTNIKGNIGDNGVCLPDEL